MTVLISALKRLVRGHTTLVLVAFAVLGALAAAASTRIEIDTSVDGLLMADDPVRPRNNALKLEFSNDEAVVIAFDLGRPFDADDLRKLHRISTDVLAIEGVEEVLDLSTIEDIRGDGETLDASPLVDFAAVDRDIDTIRARVRGHRLYQDNLVSKDLHVLVLMAVLEPFEPEARARGIREATEAILRVVESNAAPWVAYSSGYPTAEYEADRILRRDFTLLTGTALTLILLVVYAATREPSGVALVGLLILWSELVTFAWFGGSGTALSPLSSAVPTIVVATSATYGIYLLGLLGRVRDHAEPGVAVVELLARPVLLAALSTVIGFLSLRYIAVQVIGECGTALAVGTAGAAAGTLILLPAVIQRFGLRLGSRDGPYRWSLGGLRLARRPHVTIATTALLLAGAIPGIQQVRFDTDILRQFRPDSPLRMSDEFIRDRLSGSFLTNVVVRAKAPGGALEPELLRFAESLVAFLERSPIVGRTVSFLDYLHLMDGALHPERESVLPSTRRLAEQYMLLYEMAGDPDDYRHYINDDRSALNLIVRLSASSARAMALYRSIEDFAADAPEGVEVDVLGTVTLFHRTMMGITYGMLKGLLVALGLIVLTMTVVLGSVRLGLLAIVPNVIPILVCGGLLGWLGIPLSMGTSLVGCVALGLAVDDTAHVLGHLLGGGTLEETYTTVSRPLVLTTVALGAGFSALLLSAFESVALLGAGVTITLVVALLCDLFLLPSLLVLAGYRLTAAVPETRGWITLQVAEARAAGLEGSQRAGDPSPGTRVGPPDHRTGGSNRDT